jgi:hypothetical protein
VVRKRRRDDRHGLIKQGKPPRPAAVRRHRRTRTVPEPIRARAIQIAGLARRRRQRARRAQRPVGPNDQAQNFRVAILIAAALAGERLQQRCSRRAGASQDSGPRRAHRGADQRGDVEVDPATPRSADDPARAVANTEWAQSGGNASKSMGHLALGTALGQAFSVQHRAGQQPHGAARRGAGRRRRPRLHDRHAGAVRAFDAETGAPCLGEPDAATKGPSESLYGGGVAYDNGRIYATNGLGYVAALDAANRRHRVEVRPGGPLRGAPTVANDAVYVMSQDNQIYSLNEADGATNWSQAGSLEIAGVFGTASPAVAQGTVVAGFSSGELNAYRYENGRWCGRTRWRAPASDQRVVAVRHRRRSGDRQRARCSRSARAAAWSRSSSSPASACGSSTSPASRRPGSRATGCSSSPTTPS